MLTRQNGFFMDQNPTISYMKATMSLFELEPDYMRWAGPVSRAVTVCRDNFQPGIT